MTTSSELTRIRDLVSFMLERGVSRLKLGDTEIDLREGAFNATPEAHAEVEREHKKPLVPGKIEDPFFENDAEVDDELLFASS